MASNLVIKSRPYIVRSGSLSSADGTFPVLVTQTYGS